MEHDRGVWVVRNILDAPNMGTNGIYQQRKSKREIIYGGLQRDNVE